MNWSMIVLTGEQVSNGVNTRIVFLVSELARIILGDFRDFAIFSRWNNRNLEMIFSPRATEIANPIINHFNSIQIDEPNLNEGFGLEAGDTQFFFRGTER